MTPRQYRRVERIREIVVTTDVTVTDDGMTVDRERNESKSVTIHWYNEATGYELPESSAIYNGLESEFLALPENQHE